MMEGVREDCAQPDLSGLALKSGTTYWWWRCGRSAKQPFCDDSHQEHNYSR